MRKLFIEICQACVLTMLFFGPLLYWVWRFGV